MSGARTRIFEPGVSCWRVAPADRVAVLIDAADYFQALLHAMRRARSRIAIVGWDFDPRVRLDPSDPATELRQLLPELAEHGRLRAYWLRAPGEHGREINLHAKLMIVDDIFLRIGSSNLNHRSLGYDTECDLAIEAADDATRSRIAEVRNRLLAEHLMRPKEEVGRAGAETGLIAAIERLNPGGGRFQPYRIEPDGAPREPFPGTGLLDPAEPLDLDYLRRWLQHLLVAD